MPEADDSAPPPAGGSPDEQRHADRRRGEQRRIVRALWQGATALLLALLAVLAAGLLAWRVLDLERALERDRSADQLAGRDLEAIRAAIGKLEGESAASRAA